MGMQDNTPWARHFKRRAMNGHAPPALAKEEEPWPATSARSALARMALDKQTAKAGAPKVEDAAGVAWRQVQECEQEWADIYRKLRTEMVEEHWDQAKIAALWKELDKSERQKSLLLGQTFIPLPLVTPRNLKEMGPHHFAKESSKGSSKGTSVRSPTRTASADTPREAVAGTMKDLGWVKYSGGTAKSRRSFPPTPRAGVPLLPATGGGEAPDFRRVKSASSSSTINDFTKVDIHNFTKASAESHFARKKSLVDEVVRGA
ncbi:hypothetical protein T484DRAFT_1957351 [Baffinella frigidus]|nr:hypothetical protein T484DRAFT_1957351 [Cryptophyta sp. CCMP2293]